MSNNTFKNYNYFNQVLHVEPCISISSLIFDAKVGYSNQKDKVDFKSYDVTTWLTNNCNTHISQCLTKERQPGNQI